MSAAGHEGGGSGRRVRYRLTAQPMAVQCCHCRWCQRESGTAFALYALIEADRVALSCGEPMSVDTPSNSGKGQRMWRCPDGHRTLWSNCAGAGDKLRFVRVEGARSFAEYRSAEVWPADSLARRAAAFVR